MSKLLSANFMRLKKNKCFLGGMGFVFAVAVLLPVMRYTDMKKSGYINNLDSGFFICAVFVAAILSVFCSLFVGTEYGDGTIRNKIMIGHKRTHIYLSNLLTNMIVGLLMCAVYFMVYLCAGIPLLGFFESDIKVILLFVAIVLVLSCAFSSIFTMVSMIHSSKAVGAVICLLTTFLLIIAGTYINARLQEPETYSSYSYSIGGENTNIEEKNPDYLEGTQRKVYQFLYDFLPGGQVVQCASMEAENPKLLAVYSSIIFVITTAVGMVLFCKKDIN